MRNPKLDNTTEPWPQNLLTAANQWSSEGLTGAYDNYVPVKDQLPPDWEGTLMYLMARLPEREQHIILDFYCEGKTLESIGKGLGITDGRVAQLLHDALNRLTYGDGVFMLRFGIREHFKHVYGKQPSEELELAYHAGYEKAIEILQNEVPVFDHDAFKEITIPPNHAENTHVEDLRLQSYITRALLRNNITNAQQLLSMEYKNLRDMRGIGDSAILLIAKTLEHLGYNADHLKPPEKEED